MNDTANTELPSVAERIAETTARVDRVKAQRAAVALAATRGDTDARARLPGIVAELQAAELEMSILADAGQEEIRQRTEQHSAAQLAALFTALDESQSLVPALDKACAKAHDALQQWLELSGVAEEIGLQIRSRLHTVARSMNPTGETIDQRPHADRVAALCGLAGDKATRQNEITRVLSAIETRRKDLTRRQEPRELKTYRRGAKFIEPTAA